EDVGHTFGQPRPTTAGAVPAPELTAGLDREQLGVHVGDGDTGAQQILRLLLEAAALTPRERDPVPFAPASAGGRGRHVVGAALEDLRHEHVEAGPDPLEKLELLGPLAERMSDVE